jgi:hypothetical protein
VPNTSATSSKAFSLFLVQPLTVLMKQTRQAVHAIKQSILLRYLWLDGQYIIDVYGRTVPSAFERNGTQVFPKMEIFYFYLTFISTIDIK